MSPSKEGGGGGESSKPANKRGGKGAEGSAKSPFAHRLLLSPPRSKEKKDKKKTSTAGEVSEKRKSSSTKGESASGSTAKAPSSESKKQQRSITPSGTSGGGIQLKRSKVSAKSHIAVSAAANTPANNDKKVTNNNHDTPAKNTTSTKKKKSRATSAVSGPYASGSIANLVLRRMMNRQDSFAEEAASIEDVMEVDSSHHKNDNDDDGLDRLPQSQVQTPQQEKNADPHEDTMEDLSNSEDEKEKEKQSSNNDGDTSNEDPPPEKAPSRKRKKTQLLVRSKIQSQPRPSPPFVGLVKVITGPYQGLTGYLSPTGTYGYSLLSTDDGTCVTVQDNDVEDGMDPPSGSKKNSKHSREQEEEDFKVSMRDYFLERLKDYMPDKEIDAQKGEVEQLRSQNDGMVRDAAAAAAAASESADGNQNSGASNANDEMLSLRQELLRIQEEKLDRMYTEHRHFQLASRAFGIISPSNDQHDKSIMSQIGINVSGGTLSNKKSRRG